MEKKDRNLLIAAVVVVVLLLVLYYAYDKCHLGKYSKKGCPNHKGSFCGSTPDPAAGSEAMGLYELGVRAGREGFSGGCGNTSAPAAMAEAQGLMQMGWRPEHLRSRPSCAGTAPAAISEAQALQHANALSPGAPYYSKSGFESGTPCGAYSSEALGEADMMYALQAGPGQQHADDPDSSYSVTATGHYDVDGFAARKLSRDKAAFSSTRARSENLRSNPAQTSARQARFDSMREGFGGPAEAGFGWSPNSQDVAASPSTGGWGDAQSVGAAHCMSHCIDGCTGTHCADLCKDQCRQRSLIDATGVY
jgi:hypothetical protein